MTSYYQKATLLFKGYSRLGDTPFFTLGGGNKGIMDDLKPQACPIFISFLIFKGVIQMAQGFSSSDIENKQEINIIKLRG